MSNLQYIGARYVPKFYKNPDDDSANWKSGVAYESLVVVLYNSNSYTSRIPVPANIGNPEDNPIYWAKTGDFNAAMAALQNEVNSIRNGNLNDHVLTYDKLTEAAVKKIQNNDKIVLMPNTKHTTPTNSESCIFISAVSGKCTMIDAGESTSYSAIKSTLTENNVEKINYFILTHYHHDHSDNIESLIADGFIDASTIVYLPRSNSKASTSRVNEVLAAFSNNTIITAASNNPLTMDSFKFDFFNCDASDVAYLETQAAATENSFSVCNYVYHSNVTILMTGDIDSIGIDHNISLGKIKHADIIKLPHHGSFGNNVDNLYQITRPAFGIMSIDEEYYYGEGVGILNCRSLDILNAMGVSVYSSGLGALYIGLSPDEYTVVANGKKMFSNSANEGSSIDLYVDDTFTGVSLGNKENPFTSISQALAFAKTLTGIGYIDIEIVGTYNHPDENIHVANMASMRWHGTDVGGVPNVTIGSVFAYNMLLNIEKIGVVGTSNGVVRSVNGAMVLINNCVIDGDTTGVAAANGAGVMAQYGGNIWLNNVTINNKSAAFSCYYNGKIIGQNVKGTNNTYLLYGAHGDTFALTQGCTIAFSQLMTPFQNRMICANVNFMNIYGFSGTAPSIIYNKNNNGTSATEIVDFTDSLYNNRIYRIYSATGQIMQGIIKNGSSGVSTPTSVQSAINATEDPTFAVIVNGRTLEITHTSFVKVVLI